MFCPCRRLQGSSFSAEASFNKKYEKKWPHCENIGACFTNKKLKEVEKACLEDASCTGFSFTAGAQQGDGCLKKCGAAEFNGYGEGTHDYWVPGYAKKYEKKWPHCENIGDCFHGKSRQAIENICTNTAGCTGFSFTAGAETGDGCLKRCGAAEFGGYGETSHDYWVPARPQSPPFIKKYERKWPHCENIGACFSGKNRKDIEAACSDNPVCSGFSFTAGAETGDGCLKKCGAAEFGGYGETTHDYWVPPFSKKYERKWPHCENIGDCFSGKNRKEVEVACAANHTCTGFSFTAGAETGDGCLKKCGAAEFGGYGETTHDYWVKNK